MSDNTINLNDESGNTTVHIDGDNGAINIKGQDKTLLR